MVQSFISGQPSVQGEEGDGGPHHSSEMVEFGWNMIKVNSLPSVSPYSLFWHPLILSIYRQTIALKLALLINQRQLVDNSNLTALHPQHGIVTHLRNSASFWSLLEVVKAMERNVLSMIYSFLTQVSKLIQENFRYMTTKILQNCSCKSSFQILILLCYFAFRK